MIVVLTKPQRAALTAGLDTPWQWEHPRQRRMAWELTESGLMRKVYSQERWRTTLAGRLALRAKPPGTVWIPSLPSAETARDVRRLSACVVCERLCKNPPRLPAGVGHMTCFVRRDGWTAMTEAPDAELDKMRVEDLIHLGLTLDDILWLKRARMTA